MAAFYPPKLGSYFRDNWERKKPNFYPEILFEKEFIPHYPWEPLPIFQDQLQPKLISTLCHVTHQRQAQSIVRNPTEEVYIFTPGPKKGKCGYDVMDGSPLGESYRCNLNCSNPDENTSYVEVSSDEHLLPTGNYSWWGVEPVEESRYGSRKFSVHFKKILVAFRESHKRSDQNPSVIFRKAGTLRYKREICYVILVHASTDDNQYISHLPPVTNMEPRFEFHDLLNDQGIVTNWQANDPKFREAAGIHGWENVAFAFYFSPDQLRITQDAVRPSLVEHPRKCCLKKFAPHNRWDPWMCPDDVQ